MSVKKTKAAIIGVGSAGSATAFALMNQGLCEELVLIDLNKEKAYAEALDMQHSVFYLMRNMRVYAGEYSACADADVVILTASAPMPRDVRDRLAMLSPSVEIVRSIVRSVMASGFHGIFLVISNPVDLMSYLVWKTSGLPAKQVIGSGTTLDTARLSMELGARYGMDTKDVEAYVLGEHGESSMIPWRTATVGGMPLEKRLGEGGEDVRQELLNRTRDAAWEIFRRKGNTCYGIAACCAAMVRSIVLNENRVLPLSVYLNGHYGLEDVYLSVPAVIGSEGIREIVELPLDTEEQAALAQSARILKSSRATLRM